MSSLVSSVPTKGSKKSRLRRAGELDLQRKLEPSVWETNGFSASDHTCSLKNYRAGLKGVKDKGVPSVPKTITGN